MIRAARAPARAARRIRRSASTRLTAMTPPSVWRREGLMTNQVGPATMLEHEGIGMEPVGRLRHFPERRLAHRGLEPQAGRSRRDGHRPVEIVARGDAPDAGRPLGARRSRTASPAPALQAPGTGCRPVPQPPSSAPGSTAQVARSAQPSERQIHQRRDHDRTRADQRVGMRAAGSCAPRPDASRPGSSPRCSRPPGIASRDLPQLRKLFAAPVSSPNWSIQSPYRAAARGGGFECHGRRDRSADRDPARPSRDPIRIEPLTRRAGQDRGRRPARP